MFVIRHARESLATAVGVALILFVAAAPVDAQKLGGQAFRTSIGATLLMPSSDFNLQGSYGLASDSVRLPSGRAVLEIQANPNFGFHLGALRLAPNVLWDSTSTFGELEEPRYQMALNAGIVGFRLNFTTGRFRIAPYADGGVGQAQVRIDQGGGFTQSGYQPGVFKDTTSIMVGGGGGLAVDAIIGPGLTLAALGGFYHFQSIEMSEQGEPLLDPLQGLFLGGGVKLAFRDATYYWRHSGQDEDPPVIAIQSPTVDSDGVVDVGQDRTTLTLRVSDVSNVDSVFVNGTRLRLVPAPDVRSEEGRAVMTSVDLDLNPGPNSVSYVAFDGAGNRVDGEWEVLGIPLDKEGPVISILQPEDNLSISTDRLMVEAVIRDRSPIQQVTLNGLTVRAREATNEDRELVEADRDDFVVRFTSTTNVPSAEFTVSVAAVDSAGNQRLETATVQRADLARAAPPEPTRDRAEPQEERGPQIEIHTPAEWAGGGTRGLAASPRASIRVSGLARYEDGVREVLANNKRMAIQRDPSNPSIVQFSGFVEPPSAGSSGEVEILVRGRDGSQTARAYAVQSNPAPAVTSTRAQFEEVAGAKNRQRWAVVIGVSDYVDESIGDLQYADDDALAVYDFLRSPAAGMGGIPEDHIRLLLNEEATSRNIRSALTTFLRQSTPDDVIFIYIAGHGAPDPYRPDDLYILTHDTELDDIAATAVSMTYAGQAIEEAYAYNKVLFTDACHSGGMGAGTRSMNNNQINSAFLDYMNSSSGGFVTFTASESNQLSQEGEQYGGGHGVFTHFLLQGLSGEADEDGDHVITLGEAMEYTRNAVRRETRNAQVPTISQTTFDRWWPMAAVLTDEEGTEQ